MPVEAHQHVDGDRHHLQPDEQHHQVAGAGHQHHPQHREQHQRVELAAVDPPAVQVADGDQDGQRARQQEQAVGQAAEAVHGHHPVSPRRAGGSVAPSVMVTRGRLATKVAASPAMAAHGTHARRRARAVALLQHVAQQHPHRATAPGRSREAAPRGSRPGCSPGPAYDRIHRPRSLSFAGRGGHRARTWGPGATSGVSSSTRAGGRLHAVQHRLGVEAQQDDEHHQRRQQPDLARVQVRQPAVWPGSAG